MIISITSSHDFDYWAKSSTSIRIRDHKLRIYNRKNGWSTGIGSSIYTNVNVLYELVIQYQPLNKLDIKCAIGIIGEEKDYNLDTSVESISPSI